MADFIASELGTDVPWHISRYHPDFERHENATPTATLKHAYERGREAGLNYVYVGNCPDLALESTACPGCGETVIERRGHCAIRVNIENGSCAGCGTAIAGKDLLSPSS